jgi:Uma2 family endonuclease
VTQEPKPPEAPLTYAEFVAYAEAHEGRFEFDDGVIVDMGIPSDAHQDLAFALADLLNPHLRAMGCKPRLASRLVTIPGETGKPPKKERSPDVVVICDGKPRKLVCEIRSPSRGDDLGKKLAEYQAMPQFEEYLVIDSTQHWVRVYRRNESGLFEFDVDHIGGSVALRSIGYTLDIDALYRDAGVP